MFNFKMSVFIFVFLISTKSYSFFFLLLFTKENMMKMVKNEKFALCAVYNSIYLPDSANALQYSPLHYSFPLFSPTHFPTFPLIPVEWKEKIYSL